MNLLSLLVNFFRRYAENRRTREGSYLQQLRNLYKVKED